MCEESCIGSDRLLIPFQVFKSFTLFCISPGYGMVRPLYSRIIETVERLLRDFSCFFKSLNFSQGSFEFCHAPCDSSFYNGSLANRETPEKIVAGGDRAFMILNLPPTLGELIIRCSF